MDTAVGDRWQEWLMVTSYLVFLGVVAWRVLLTK
jgi:hypothetical protein